MALVERRGFVVPEAGGSNAPIALVQAADWKMTTDGGLSSKGWVKREVVSTEIGKEVVTLLKAIAIVCVCVLFLLILVLFVFLSYS